MAQLQSEDLIIRLQSPRAVGRPVRQRTVCSEREHRNQVVQCWRQSDAGPLALFGAPHGSRREQIQ
jgi:hypothetical protein